jgi:hypothetical protein
MPLKRAGSISLGPPSRPYSPECVEGAFSEVRPEGFSEVSRSPRAFPLPFFSASVVLPPGEGLGRTPPGR